MIQTAIDYAKELHKAGMTHEELSSVKDIFDVVPQVKDCLLYTSPSPRDV